MTDFINHPGRLRGIYLATSVFLLVAVLSAGIWLSAARAAPLQAGSLSLSPSSGPPGSTVTVSGSGWTSSNGPYKIFWGSKGGTELGSFDVSGGNFSTHVNIPGGASPGGHQILACEGYNTEFEGCSSASFQVTSPATNTPKPPTNTPRPPTPIPPPDSTCDSLGLGPETVTADFDSSNVLSVETSLSMQFGGSAEITEPSVAPRSGSRALKSMEGVDFGSSMRPIQMTFLRPVNALGMFVGLDGAPFVTSRVTAKLTVYGYRDGETELSRLGSDSAQFPPEATDIEHCLRLTAGSGSIITQAVLEYRDAAGTSIAEPRLLDDLTIVYAEEELPFNKAPEVHIVEPEGGAVFRDMESVRIRANIFEDRLLYDGWFTVNESERQEIGVTRSAEDPTRYRAVFDIPVSDLMANAHHIVTVGATDIEGKEGSSQTSFRFEPPFDAQVRGIEVTQGIRQEIPTRMPPDDPLGLGSDSAVHVADRRTVVRVYPWVEFIGGSPGRTSGLTAHLYGSRDGTALPGSPLSPENITIRPSSGQSLETMRANAGQSWNFVLPDSWSKAGTISLRVLVNPTGPYHQEECAGCEGNNQSNLGDIQFVQVLEKDIEVDLYMADFYWRDDEGDVVRLAPTVDQAATAIANWRKVWPVATNPDGDSGVLTVDDVKLWPISWNVPDDKPVDPPIPGVPTWLNEDIFDDNPGVTSSTRDFNHFIILVFNPMTPMGCVGWAGVPGPPLFHGGACWDTFAQEATHTLGRAHASTDHKEDPPIDPGFPQDHGKVESGLYGFDLWELQAVPPSVGGHTHDYMSYGGMPKWTSIYTWTFVASTYGQNAIRVQRPGGAPLLSMAQQMDQRADQSPDQQSSLQDGLRITGEITPDGEILFEPAFITQKHPDAIRADGEGDFSLVFLDGEGSTLFVRKFTPSLQTHEAPKTYRFYEVVPPLDGLERVQLYEGDQLLAEMGSSPNPPEVKLKHPTAGTHWSNDGSETVRWAGSDPDGGDSLTYRLEISPDGQTWQVLRGKTGGSQMEVDLSWVPGSGPNWHLRVQASDGLHVTTDQISPIEIDPKAPWPIILQPLDGDTFASNQKISLEGKAVLRNQKEDEEYQLIWEVDGKVIGQDPTGQISDLKSGEHQITLTASSPEGGSSSMSVSISIIQDSDFDGLSDPWESENGLDPNDGTDAAADNDQDGLHNWQEYRQGSDPNEPDTDNDGHPDQEELQGRSDPSDPQSIPQALHGVPIAGDHHQDGEGSPASEDQAEADETADTQDTILDRIAQSDPAVLILIILTLSILAAIGVGLLVYVMRTIRK